MALLELTNRVLGTILEQLFIFTKEQNIGLETRAVNDKRRETDEDVSKVFNVSGSAMVHLGLVSVAARRSECGAALGHANLLYCLARQGFCDLPVGTLCL